VVSCSKSTALGCIFRMRVRVRSTLRSALIVSGSLGATAAGAVPSGMWNQVERIVVACHFDGSIASTSVRQELCSLIVAEANRLTSYPVTVADPADLTINPDRLKQQDRQLILHVEATALRGGVHPSEVALAIRPERVGLRRWKGSLSKPTSVAVHWSNNDARLKRPLEALEDILSEPRRGGVLPGLRNTSPGGR
jgi:hypothetical protein